MRTRTAQSLRVAGRTKAVSAKLSSLAILCMVTASNSDASGKTASGFPAKGSAVKTSTTVYAWDRLSAITREPPR